MQKLIKVYDCSGKLVHSAIVKNDALNLRKDLGVSDGLYLVRVNDKAVSEKK
jgi:hypothetical protein